MSRLVDAVIERLDEAGLGRLGGAIDAELDTTRRAAASTLTALFGKLRDGLTSDVAAKEFHAALLRSFDGTLLEDVPGYFSEPPPSSAREPDAADDVLGLHRQSIEDNLSRELALSTEQVRRLNTLLTPVVLNVLATVCSKEGLEPDELANEIVRDTREIWQKEPEAMRSVGRLVGDAGSASKVVDVGIGSLD